MTFTGITALISLFMKDQYAINYMNTSFIIGLVFLMFAGAAYTIIGGFWDVFIKGSKIVFRRREADDDDTHWSFDKEEEEDEVELMREGAKRELFIFLPLTAGLTLLVQAIAILFLI